MAKFAFIQGKAKWAKLSTPNKFGDWTLDLYVDDKNLEKVRELKAGKPGVAGIMNTIKKDDDGTYVTFKRPQQKTYGGKVIGFAAPEVLNGSITLPDGSSPPLRDVMVGNGSDVTVKLEIFNFNKPDRTKGTACRLLSVRVDNLVPYTIKRDFGDEEQRAVKGLDSVPPQQPAW